MSNPSCLQPTLDGGVLLSVEVHPGSQNERLLGVNQWRSRLGVSVRAQAQKGQANRAVIAYLCDVFSMPKAGCSIVNGHTSRSKTVRFDNTNCAQLIEAMERAMEEQ
tara:strand:+ start:2198 stop:2518 length:321 start_codon:yes stop_codon:yes gene_type:complete